MTDDYFALKDGLEPDGTYCVYLMSNSPIEREVPAEARVYQGREAGTYIFRAIWPYRGICQIVRQDYSGWQRVVVLWALSADDRISVQAVNAAQLYYDEFCLWPTSAWIAKLPKGVELGAIIKLPFEAADLENEMVLMDAEFVPRGFLAVGRGGVQPE